MILQFLKLYILQFNAALKINYNWHEQEYYVPLYYLYFSHLELFDRKSHLI